MYDRLIEEKALIISGEVSPPEKEYPLGLYGILLKERDEEDRGDRARSPALWKAIDRDPRRRAAVLPILYGYVYGGVGSLGGFALPQPQEELPERAHRVEGGADGAGTVLPAPGEQKLRR